ncbi:unnamed protein product [Menidia menidia]|uniref:Neurotensin/neuromedin N n=1 Tax=Menidia menidia TaxID=238744 RepID=A0A8S4BF32_9TELE|nr:unnamed protein product [Menidia menidia]
MQAQLACVVFLCFTCGALCTDVDQEQRVLAEEFLSSLLTSKMKHSRQSAPFWQVSLASLCRLVGDVRQGLWSSEEEEVELREGGLHLLEELYSLQHICRGLEGREERLDESITGLKAKALGEEKTEGKKQHISPRRYLFAGKKERQMGGGGGRKEIRRQPFPGRIKRAAAIVPLIGCTQLLDDRVNAPDSECLYRE